MKPGQRLVSLEGDLWRWDGFLSAADAPTPAARRLAEKNRLGDLAREAEAARQAAEALKAEAAKAQAALRDAAAIEASARSPGARCAGRDRRRARAARLDRAAARADPDQITALDEALARAIRARDEAVERRNAAEAALQSLAPSDELTTDSRARAGGGGTGARRIRRGARGRAEPCARA